MWIINHSNCIHYRQNLFKCFSECFIDAQKPQFIARICHYDGTTSETKLTKLIGLNDRVSRFLRVIRHSRENDFEKGMSVELYNQDFRTNSHHTQHQKTKSEFSENDTSAFYEILRGKFSTNDEDEIVNEYSALNFD